MYCFKTILFIDISPPKEPWDDLSNGPSQGDEALHVEAAIHFSPLVDPMVHQKMHTATFWF